MHSCVGRRSAHQPACENGNAYRQKDIMALNTPITFMLEIPKGPRTRELVCVCWFWAFTLGLPSWLRAGEGTILVAQEGLIGDNSSHQETFW